MADRLIHQRVFKVSKELNRLVRFARYNSLYSARYSMRKANACSPAVTSTGYVVRAAPPPHRPPRRPAGLGAATHACRQGQRATPDHASVLRVEPRASAEIAVDMATPDAAGTLAVQCC